MIAAIILAAGESKRMGSPKALVQFAGMTFVEHLLSATRHPRVGARRVVLGAGAEEIRAKLSTRDATVVVNEEWKNGPLTSIHAGLRSLDNTEVEGALICPVGHPLVTVNLIISMIRAFDTTPCAIVVPASFKSCT